MDPGDVDQNFDRGVATLLDIEQKVGAAGHQASPAAGRIQSGQRLFDLLRLEISLPVGHPGHGARCVEPEALLDERGYSTPPRGPTRDDRRLEDMPILAPMEMVGNRGMVMVSG
jgi:hypothetical protein